MKFIKANVCLLGLIELSDLVIKDLHKFVCCVSAIILKVFYCKVSCFLLLEELLKKVI